jgi:hypothetical protein
MTKVNLKSVGANMSVSPKQKENFQFSIILVAICLTASITFSCKKDKDDDKKLTNTVLEQEYFTIQNGTVHKGSIPSSSSGISIDESININDKALAGSSSFVSIAPEKQVSEIYVGVKDVDFYFSIKPEVQSKSGIQLKEDEISYTFVILFSQNLDDSFEIEISIKFEDGSLSTVFTNRVEYIQAGTGSLQVNLSFDNLKDVDLYVVQPDGEVICWDNRGSHSNEDETQNWGLDVDSNAICWIDGINSENIFYPKDFIQSGKYEVWVNMFYNCDPSIATNWVITALYEGALVTVSYGKNPEHGVFPVGTPSNMIGTNINDMAVKVMEFTMTGNSKAGNLKNSVRSPLTESAKEKMRIIGELVD